MPHIFSTFKNYKMLIINKLNLCEARRHGETKKKHPNNPFLFFIRW